MTPLYRPIAAPRGKRTILSHAGRSSHGHIIQANGLRQNWDDVQAQRVVVARALVASPEALLLEEQFSAIHAMTRSRLQHHLFDIGQATMAIVPHDLDEAIKLVDRGIRGLAEFPRKSA